MSEKSDKVSKKSKEVNAELESLFKEEDSDYITYEKIAQIILKADRKSVV